jgi:hypothetical protein
MKIKQEIIEVRKKQIWKATFLACGVATVLCVLFIFPAEYGYDPTGIGELTGVKNMSVDQIESAPGSVEGEYGLFATSVTPFASSTEVITLPVGEGIEYKLDIDKGKAFIYNWKASSPLYYDMHADPTEDDGKAFLPFKSYEIATAEQSSGFLVTEFTGNHGWYWLNQTGEPVTITLNVSGFYEKSGLVITTPQ